VAKTTTDNQKTLLNRTECTPYIFYFKPFKTINAGLS